MGLQYILTFYRRYTNNLCKQDSRNMTTNVIYPNDILESRKYICLKEEKLDVDEGKFQIKFPVLYLYSM